MKIVISSGHGLKIRGASGILDEVDEARRVVEKVTDLLLRSGVGVIAFNDDISTTQQENLECIVDFHNMHERDLDVSVHFNCYDGSAHGVECLYVTHEDLADDVASNIADASGIFNRGPKYRSDLYFLNNTHQPSILIETAFVDSETDAELYRENFDAICKAIAETIADIDLGDQEESEPEEPVAAPPLTGDNRVDIFGAAQGDVAVIINGKLLRGKLTLDNAVALNIRMTGDVMVSINGQDFHNVSDAIPENQTNILASVFGGGSDYNVSAYDESWVLNDTDLYVALPNRFEGDRPLVRVINQITGVMMTAEIADVGPWLTDDPYYETGTRPLAETCANEDEPLPRGPNEGMVPNGAGIDLSPALAKALGIDGMGKVDWDFVDDAA